jgi:ribonuclease P protein component
LTCQTQFQRVFKRAQRSSDGCFTVLAAPNGTEHARLGLAISKKAARSAVVRNRVKRIARESFRHHQAALGGLDVVVLARAGIAVKSRRELHASLTRHWARLIQRCARS